MQLRLVRTYLEVTDIDIDIFRATKSIACTVPVKEMNEKIFEGCHYKGKSLAQVINEYILYIFC